ncbi:hypothetical protein GHT09_018191 [Marmota monax]|uniref:Uncharacterized protein n=1 Tax=Marmota monax TaxID=9995 RepID=A0A834PKV5_MARMO|nr:hypothetical protein GHT09_018191 [Marmota monax]
MAWQQEARCEGGGLEQSPPASGRRQRGWPGGPLWAGGQPPGHSSLSMFPFTNVAAVALRVAAYGHSMWWPVDRAWLTGSASPRKTDLRGLSQCCCSRPGSCLLSREGQVANVTAPVRQRPVPEAEPLWGRVPSARASGACGVWECKWGALWTASADPAEAALDIGHERPREQPTAPRPRPMGPAGLPALPPGLCAVAPGRSRAGAGPGCCAGGARQGGALGHLAWVPRGPRLTEEPRELWCLWILSVRRPCKPRNARAGRTRACPRTVPRGAEFVVIRGHPCVQHVPVPEVCAVPSALQDLPVGVSCLPPSPLSTAQAATGPVAPPGQAGGTLGARAVPAGSYP